jgi:DNA helicase-2/ATP-dependent DNA helicase PcrA
MSIDLTTLNENQRKAVLWNKGPMLVLAGPGSGKTRVLTFRVARLLQEQEDTSVLALTFTNKAAAEMRERLDQLLGEHSDRAHLCTFHSFATDILRQHGSHLDIKPDFTLLTQDEDRVALLDEIALELAQEAQGIPTDRKNLLELIDHLFAESYSGVGDAPSLSQTPDWLPKLFSRYCSAIVSANRLDFGSLLHFTKKLLREHPGVSRVVGLAWPYVCVDEFQDTNKAQYDLLRLLVAEKSPNVFIVADDDQIIYQWNGASPERLTTLTRDYQMEVVQLPENYRCPPEIIDLANKLIAHNRLRTAGKLPLKAFRSASLSDNVIRYGAFETIQEELAAIVGDIKTRNLAPTECVILARTTKLLTEAAHSLRTAGFEAYVASRKTDFEAPVVRVMLNALRLTNARHDRDVLRRLCVAWEAFSDCAIAVEDVVASAALVGGDFLRAWMDMALRGEQTPSVLLLERLRHDLLDRSAFPGVVDWFFLQGWKPWSDEKDNELTEEISTWQALHGDIVREHSGDNLTLNVYLQQLDLAPKTPRPGLNAIRCLTVHGAKGLEFKHVYLMGMAQEMLPSFQSLRKGHDSKELEEERRNCFVAVTRVKETLTLTRARQYNGWSKGPSQFIAEMGLNPA